MTSSSRHFSASYVPRSQIVMVPAPYSPLGISPWNSRFSSGWSSVRTARWLRLGSSGIPLGTAHEARTPSCSGRRSQCRRVAWCSWTTKRPAAAGASAPSPAPAGSLVAAKSRLPRYSASRSRVMPSAIGGDARALARVVRALARVARDLGDVDLVGLAVDRLVGLLGEAVELLAHVDLDLGLRRAVL